MKRSTRLFPLLACTLALHAPALDAAGGAGGSGSGPTSRALPADNEFDAGVGAIRAGDYPRGIALMSAYAGRDVGNPHAWNWLGYAYRKSGDVAQALRHYEKALALDPEHRGAREYLGEAYLMLGDLTRAEEQLAILDRLCWLPCEEYTDLKQAIAAYRAKPASSP